MAASHSGNKERVKSSEQFLKSQTFFNQGKCRLRRLRSSGPRSGLLLRHHRLRGPPQVHQFPLEAHPVITGPSSSLTPVQRPVYIGQAYNIVIGDSTGSSGSGRTCLGPLAVLIPKAAFSLANFAAKTSARTH
jgi:hypothetical protein